MEAVLEQSSAIKGKIKGIENLIPYAKGTSGNPSGRPKAAFDFAGYLRRWLQEPDGDKKRLEVILDNLAESKPEVILNYAYGKPIEHIKIEGDANPMNSLAIEVARLIVAQQVKELTETKSIEVSSEVLTPPIALKP